MAEDWEINARHENGVELENMRQRHRLDIRNLEEAKQSEIAKIDGENEYKLTELKHNLDIENRQFDLQAEARKLVQDFELEVMQTLLKQQDEFVRHFWELDKELVSAEGRVVELVVAADIQQQQTVLEHKHLLEIKDVDHENSSHEKILGANIELTRLIHENELDKDNFEFKERLRLELALEHGTTSQEEIADIIAKMKGNSKSS